MKAMIFAAGLGTRLYPITQKTPKALVKINNIPLIEWIIKRLKSYGFDEIIINVHHHADQIEEFLKKNKFFGADISFSDERQQLLDTGGGLKKASWFFNDGKPFLVHNVDVITDLYLQEIVNFHTQSKGLATVAVRVRSSSRYLLFNRHNILCGWENTKTDERIVVRPSDQLLPYAFSGIQIIDPEIFKYITFEGKFSIIDLYLELARSHSIFAFLDNDSVWMDLGKPENLKEAENLFIKSSPYDSFEVE